MAQAFPVPAAVSKVETEAKRSRFYSALAHAPDPQSVRSFLAEVKNEHSNAHHHCWAYVAGEPGSTARIGCSDDGEPNGTAGQPMLKVLLHSGVGEIVAVVTRYFGGTKLGRGGLVRAYSGGVQAALKELTTVQKIELVKLNLTIEYAELDRFKQSHNQYGAQIQETVFSDRVKIWVELPEDRLSSFRRWIADLTNGQSDVQVLPDA